MRPLFLILLTSSLVTAGALAAETGAGRATVTMEGATHDLDPVDGASSTVTSDDTGVLFYLTATDQPVSINFNLFDRSVLTQGSVDFTLPADNAPKARVELSFFNPEREGRRLQRRIIFSEGTITVRRISERSLALDFDGQGHPLMDATMFPIRGTIEVDLP
ncbi:hypothetical protein [Albidovulum sediminis]|uniref:Uncharacterized protein n=1 Tax=Albidovulum sediminis TaxID=3066345 RepID=A0ABT2NIZ6_9RHOB|nr:hypothetical protein [Defluviimonas sediminis]MCT8328893.1 hypothetical protein [Defluviimonas sediminis]